MRDPYVLIRETDRLRRRRERTSLGLTALPPVAALASAAVAGRLPVELVAASALALGLVALYATSARGGCPDTAALLDRALGAKEHFLTLATLAGPAPLLAVVEAKASELGRDADPRAFRPPLPRRRLFWSTFLSAALLALLWLLPASGVADAPADRLREIAAELAATGDPADAALARTLAKVALSVRDRSKTAEAKRHEIRGAMRELEKRSGQGESDDAAGSGRGQGKGGKAERGRDGSGRERSAGAGGGSDLRGQAKGELERLERETGGGESSAGAAREARKTDVPRSTPGGSVEAPQKPNGAKRREESPGEGNRPAPTQGEARDRPGTSGRSDQAKSDRGAAPSPGGGGRARGGAATSDPGAAGKPSSDPDGPPADRFYAPGAGGWRIENGRYVSVRVPDPGGVENVERVQKPGEVVTETPYGNAPPPSQGPPGEVHDAQPVPLEYRDLLKP